MHSVYDELKERGFILQATDEENIQRLLSQEQVTCYIGFDPTATSLHVGSLIPIMSLAHMQRFGHHVIALIGGATALIGDPSGKTEMRQILTREQVDYNARCIGAQLARYLDFSRGNAVLLNNADWLSPLNYIEFLRDIGRHFSVNKMLAAESYRMRLERGLNFVEFNYMLLQAYDFWYLYRHHGCNLQMGGNDQWGNMLAGCDLIRRLEGGEAYAITFPLITTTAGHKMGKTNRGTVWLDPHLTSPYEYYQYWVNTEDEDVERFLSLFTLLPMEEIRRVGELKDRELNMAKTVLAFEATRITHGEQAAIDALRAACSAFNIPGVNPDLLPSSTIPREMNMGNLSAIPKMTIPRETIANGIPAYELFFKTRLCTTKSEARRLIEQGGAYVNGRQITVFDEKIGENDVKEEGIIRLRKGKKSHFVVQVV